MPANYAHYIFGKAISKDLPSPLDAIINKNKELFLIGLHGPDILFYYKPLSSNSVNALGHRMHAEIAAPFFEYARSVIQSQQGARRERSISYIMGFICHFMLDSECHGYIAKKIAESGVSHCEIETEFDRYLLVKEHKNPLTADLARHIVSSPENAAAISAFFPDLSDKEIEKSLDSIKWFSKLLVSPNHVKRTALVTGLKAAGKYDAMGGLLVNFEPNPKCADSCQTLFHFLKNAIHPTLTLMEEYYAHLDEDEPLNERFQRNFE